jgi:putative ABC transport system substrate-binding protein
MMKRREFITVLGGAAALPLAARAQQRERMRRIGVLLGGFSADDPLAQIRITVFAQGLQQLGWTVGRNAQIEYRYASGNRDLIRKYAEELVALAPDVVLADGGGSVGPLQQASRAVPIVFVAVADPVGGGFVTSLSKPGRNATGFIAFEYGLAGKWTELLKQTAPFLARAAVLRDPTQFAGGGQLGAIQAVAPFFGIELIPVDVRDVGEMEGAIAGVARQSNTGLIVLGSFLAQINRRAIIGLAAQYRLPAVYYSRDFVVDGGLISYGSNQVEQYRLAAGYVDRILKGEKPADLPVQAPTKYELVINLKTAKALGLDIPATVYARADEVIE